MKALVLAGDGVNCERETAQAFELSGFEAHTRHINDLIAEKLKLDQLSSQYSVLALPGGFSFGDDISSGKVLALKIRHALNWDLSLFAERGGLVIGICNGFQALIKMGIFGSAVSITHNEGGKFIDQWVKVEPVSKKCVWTKGIGTLDLPIRHGEGRIAVEYKSKGEILDKLRRQEMMSLRYTLNPNGSDDSLAGLCDSSGRIFGLMPHPEAFVRWTAHPEWTTHPEGAGSPGQGLQFFENAFQYAKEAR